MTSVESLSRISNNDYDRERSMPAREDVMYLHLSDLRLTLEQFLTGASGRWLDYGANTSPYRSLLSRTELLRADIHPAPGLNYLITPGEPCPAGDEEFDGILTTQVLEHVPGPQGYLRDCFRMLKPSGRLVLTTHGTWEDHGCPDDFWRWTAEGLTKELSNAGFRVLRCKKLTAELRGLIQLAIHRANAFRNHGRSLPALILHLLGGAAFRHRSALARFADHNLKHLRSTNAPEARIYLALAIEATKSPPGSQE